MNTMTKIFKCTDSSIKICVELMDSMTNNYIDTNQIKQSDLLEFRTELSEYIQDNKSQWMLTRILSYNH